MEKKAKHKVWKPDEIIRDLAIEEPDEIDLIAIGSLLSAKIRCSNLDGAAATLVGAGDEALITVKGTDVENLTPRQRFSVGHELGHWMYDRERATFECQERIFVTAWGKEPGIDPERVANNYAADLLMPRKMFTSKAMGKPITFDSVDELSQLFKTSATSTVIRLVELGSSYAFACCVEEGRRTWFARNLDVAENLYPTRRPSRESLAYRMHNDLVTGKESLAIVPATAWFDVDSAKGVSLVENSRRLTRDLTLSLLYWSSEAEYFRLVEEPEDE